MRKASLYILLFVSLLLGQTVNITGKVSNTSGQGIAGAVIKIFNTPLSCTSNSDGTYLLTGQVGTLPAGNAVHQTAYSLNYKNGIFTFNGPADMPASAALYDVRGRLVAKVFSGLLTQGTTKVSFSVDKLGKAMLVLRVAIGDKEAKSMLVSTAADHFAVSGSLSKTERLSKTAALDWIQASKSGFASVIQTLDSYNTTVNFTLGVLPAAPDFGPNTHIFDATMSSSSIQGVLDAAHTASSQFGTNRAAFFFKPGSYSVNITVRYYMQAYGLGMSPEDVQVTGTVQATEDGTGSFWRGVEGFSVTPTGGQEVWAVSQADPFRRMHVKGTMSICNSGASGGFISDSKIDGAISTGCAQQFYIRNSVLNGIPSSGIWNFLVQGCDNPPAENWPSGGISVVAKTPLVREKPYVVFDNNAQTYSVFVPALRTNSQGITWDNGTPAGDLLPIDQFYIAIAGTDNATTINAALAQGKNLILTPGIYVVSTPILVQRPNTVVLGLGMATLQAQNGSICLKTADADGIIVANILYEAGTGGDSPCLLQIGDSGSVADHSANPPFVFDLFARCGGSVVGTTKIGAIFNSNNTILDHSWIWRADHGAGAGWNADSTTIRDGLYINGNNCITYGQMVEHWQKYNTVWNGENGQQYFYQNELPYDVPNQASWMEGAVPGIPAIKVTSRATKFYGWGLGIYSYMRRAAITTTNAIEAPKLPGISVHRVVTFALAGDQGTILHAVNDTGAAVKNPSPTMIRFGDYVGH
ncbi:MAG TPA: carboxypeptidase-like regulatory domain-containing protein [Chitinivibrionales bacterium]|nr:carboxypeptidase-like regulatory domain-containing protein [Chitinivibrionales bacterium]